MARSRSRGPRRLIVVAGTLAVAGGTYLARRLAAARNAELLRRHSAQPDFVPEPRANEDLPVDTAAAPRPGDTMEDLAPVTDRSDEEAEIQAAAAEAGAIGGTVEPAFDEEGEPADEAEQPLYEAGEGYAEGAEQSEAQLEDVIAEAEDEEGQRRGKRFDRELEASDPESQP
jgi:hypothetical protein